MASMSHKHGVAMCGELGRSGTEAVAIEIVSATEQVFNGECFRLYRGSKYFSKRSRRLHRVVWEYHHGPVPKGYHVHHKDHDRANNQIGNLELLTPKEHLAHHVAADPEGRRETRLRGLERARVAAANWHRSPE